MTTERNKSGEPLSFFDLFTYHYLEDEASDALYIYEQCEIKRDITTTLGHKLVKGTKYEQMNWSITRCEFEFVTFWEQNVPGDTTYYPGHGSLVIPQTDLAPYLVWWDKDRHWVAGVGGKRCADQDEGGYGE